MKTFLLTFMLLSIINVVFSTARSIITIKGGKLAASLMSGGYFAFYNVMMIYTVMDFSMWQKCLITFICNVVGVFIVKTVEEFLQKDKLWKIEATVDTSYALFICNELDSAKIPYNYIENIGKWTIFNIFSATKSQSAIAKEILRKYDAKCFASESKIL